MYYGFEPYFWLKLIIILGVFLLLLFSFHTVMRKLLKLEKVKFFSNNYLNEEHKKIDRKIRITSIVVLLIGFIINVIRGPVDKFWFFEPYFLFFLSIIASESARTFMEWKYQENRKAYIFTINQLVFLVIFMVSLFTTDFYAGFFDWFLVD